MKKYSVLPFFVVLATMQVLKNFKIKMILEKLKTYHQILGSFSSNQHDILGVYYPLDQNRILYNIRKGKWSILTYNCGENSLGSDGLRILPYLPSDQWPEVDTMNGSLQSSLSHLNILTRFTEGKFQLCFRNRSYCERISNRWGEYYEAISPVYKLFGGTDDLEELKKVAFDKENWPNENTGTAEIEKKYRAHKLKLDPSRENQYLYELIDKFNENDKFAPSSLPDFDLGIYENRILSMISCRMTMKYSEERQEEDAKMILQCVNYTHGFDTEDRIVFDKTGATATYLSLKDHLRVLFSEYSGLVVSPELKDSPEYYIAKKINEGGYTGTAHLEMATVMDEQLNDPKRAWSYLVSAGYWAGRNMPEAQETILKAAICLCEKRNWLEGKEVLEYNLGLFHKFGK